MNEYQKKLLEGLERFSYATSELLDARINNSKVKEKFHHYETFERLLLTVHLQVNRSDEDRGVVSD